MTQAQSTSNSAKRNSPGSTPSTPASGGPEPADVTLESYGRPIPED